MNSALYDNVTAAGIKVDHACEVGVYLPEMSNVLGWINSGVRTTLVECDPQIVAKLHESFDGFANVHIKGVAVSNEIGRLTFYRQGASTFGSNLPISPARINDGYIPLEDDEFTVVAVTFDGIDDDTIDVLSIDIEGGEWYVLKYLRSSPEVVSVETHGQEYVNPFQKEIDNWMKENEYGAWYFDGSDTVYRKNWTTPVLDLSPKLSFVKRVKKQLRRV